MTLKSLPLSVREVSATEAHLEAIYEAARLGLKDDALALAAGFQPIEFRRLCELDPIVELAVQKGRADTERELSTVLHTAARSGDTKVALELLKHTHGWVAKQAISVEVDQRISVIDALRAAEERVVEALPDPAQAMSVLPPSKAPSKAASKVTYADAEAYLQP